MSKAILEALLRLDPTNDEHWTADGAPRLEAMKLEGVKRTDIIKAAPQFSRSNPKLVTQAEEKLPAEKQGEADPLVLAQAKVDEANARAEKTGEALRQAQQEHGKAIAAQDLALREMAALEGARTTQHDLMDYIAAENVRRAERAKRARERGL